MENIKASGLSPKRLQYVDDYLQRIVDTKQGAGVSAMIIRHGVTAYRKSFGMADVANNKPMTPEAIFRLFSMTKTFTIVAAMTLYEKGLFKLRDPISDFLPEFANMQVGEYDERGIMQLVPAKTPVTFEHLFTMTSGVKHPMLYTRHSPYSSLGPKPENAPAEDKPPTTAELVASIAKEPLFFHPGEQWMYGFSHDVLGRLIEVISGKRFGEYLKDTIFDPLGLQDTAFYVPAEKQSRLTKVYDILKDDIREAAEGAMPTSTTPPAFESGGAGLCSTLDDVGLYAKMLLGNGKSGDVRILSRKTIELIRMNHLPRELYLKFGAKHIGFEQVMGYGYGLGVRTMLDRERAGLNDSVGEWAWDGALGTWYCVDPTEDMTAIFLIQRRPGSNGDLPLRFCQTVYSAIDD
ncbi:serine hydrolase [Spirochaetia bacterium]|nr:serine hydrolase [Spirochaetia bacterium]